MNKFLVVGAVLGLVLVTSSNAQYYRNMDPFQYVRNAMANIPRFNGFGFPNNNSYQPWTPWYKGPNVCMDEQMKPVNTDAEDELMKDFGDVKVTADLRSEAETCRGDNEKHKCVARVYNNGVSSTRTRTYTCCKNFVRSSDGSPGCVPKA